MNVLFDTNVVIDLFTDTDDFKAAFTAVDVAQSPVSVLSPTEFIGLFKPSSIDYGWETLLGK